METRQVDTLDPEYWTQLGNIAQQGKKLILEYGGETAPAERIEKVREGEI